VSDCLVEIPVSHVLGAVRELIAAP
jgi:hypothetical protein